MPTTATELKVRTKRVAIQIVRLYRTLPATNDARVIGNQLLRSGTSLGANYRAVCRARSTPDFVSKIGITIEEADESLFWLELLVETGVVPGERVRALVRELNELTAIFVAAQRTARGH